MRRLLVAVGVGWLLAAPASAGPPAVQADAFLVQDGASGEVLASHDARERIPIASITKLMTVLVTLDRARLGETVVVSPAAVGAAGSSIGLRIGERLTVRELVEAALVQSANDAANALAAHVGRGSIESFVAMMNARARALGLRDTRFVRADGLDVPGHVSSARDVTKLARVAMRKPVVRAVVRMRAATISGGRNLHTWNDLLTTFPGVIGVKTGHTSAAGWSQAAAARGRGFTIYATLLGSPSRTQRNADLTALLRWGLSRYRSVTLIRAGRVYARVATEFGRPPVPLVPPRPLVRTVRVDRPLAERVVSTAFAALPIRAGQRLGEVRIYAGRRLIGRRPLVAARSVSRPGLTDRVGWYAERTADRVLGWFS